MKDSEFIELLNLYLDHEISAADAARLEAEVQGNPSRRSVYQDYCRMQKACKLLAEDFATPALAGERNVVPFDHPVTAAPHRRFAWVGAAGLAAAAAVVAVVFVHRSNSVAPATEPAGAVAQATPAAAPQPALVPQPAASVPVQMVADHQPAQVNEALSLRHLPEQTDALALTNPVSDPHFSWIQDVHLRPLQLPAAGSASGDQLQFELTPSLRTQNRTYSSGKQPLPADVPWIAIRFQR